MDEKLGIFIIKDFELENFSAEKLKNLFIFGLIYKTFFI